MFANVNEAATEVKAVVALKNSAPVMALLGVKMPFTESSVRLSTGLKDGLVSTENPVDDGLACHENRVDDGLASHGSIVNDKLASHKSPVEDGLTSHDSSVDDGVASHESLVDHGLACQKSQVDDGLACPTSDDTVMSLLFEADLDEALQLVFLCLSPFCLRAARLVCRAWRDFIRRRLWGSSTARGRLGAKLVRRWREARAPVRRIFTSHREVYSMTCDQDKVYCGSVDGFLQVFCRLSGTLLYERYCHTEDTLVPEVDGRGGVQVDTGPALVACISERAAEGVVSVWERQSGALLYLGRAHGPRPACSG